MSPPRPRRTRSRPLAVALLVALTLLVPAGCGRDDGRDRVEAADTSAPTTSLPPSTTTSTPGPTGTAGTPQPTATTSTTSPTTAALDDRTVTTAANPAPSGDGTEEEPPTTTTGESTATTAAPGGPPGFTFEVSPITAALAARMTPTSWREGCPVALADLRYLRIAHWDFAGQAQVGELVVHADVVADLEFVFARLYATGFPVGRMRLVDDYGGDDFTSIEAGNTSAFNCRAATGSTNWSRHAYGRAIDVNPLENPYVSGGSTDHPASVPYLDRTARPGMATEGSALVAALDAVGWDWGGRWSDPVDYQHFSATGG